jgi:membrane-associated protease RseP (regulator of RpoE activity)
MDNINPLLFLAALFGVTLWHELGHWAVARWLRVPVLRVNIGMGPVLWRHTWWRNSVRQAPDLIFRALPLGMSVAIPVAIANGDIRDGTIRHSRAQDFWIAAGGPCASFLLTVLLFAAARWLPMPYSWAYALVGVGILSASVALLNLLPIPGLDGGHLLLAGSARMGWKLKRNQESHLQRIGMRLVLSASLLSILYCLWVG